MGDERFDHRHDWRGGKRDHNKVSAGPSGGDVEKTLGEIRQLMTGTTSMAASGSVYGFIRNLDDFRHLEGLNSIPMNYETFPLDGGKHVYPTEGCEEYSKARYLADFKQGTNLMHVGEGIDAAARNEFVCLNEDKNGGLDVTEPNNSYIHAIALNASDAAILANSGTAAVWSPRSNISLYGNTAPISLFQKLGVNIALGTDWVPSGSAHLLRELQCADSLNQKHFDKTFTDYQLWLMATANGADAMKMEKEIGRLDVGFFADIAIFKDTEENPYRSIINSSASNTLATFRAGKNTLWQPRTR